MATLAADGDLLRISVERGELRPRHESQLALWGFILDGPTGHFLVRTPNLTDLAHRVSAFFSAQGIQVEFQGPLVAAIASLKQQSAEVFNALDNGRNLKSGHLPEAMTSGFLSFLAESVPRRLKEHQIKAALHLLTTKNAANFSVPGSGKTTVVLSAFEWLRQRGEIDCLFVVGPPACFRPWRDEYRQVIGREARHEIYAGGDVDIRRSNYAFDETTPLDLCLTTFQTLQRDVEQVQRLFATSGRRFFLVVDEAHYIKQIGGQWADAALRISPAATRRCVLTGTPFPKNYCDGFNLFDLLWPHSSPLHSTVRHRIELHEQRGEHADAAELLKESIDPLFYRVRKRDLGLAEQVFHPPIRIDMNAGERRLYDTIIDRIEYEDKRDYARDLEVAMRLRRARIVRLRQCTSFAGLLTSALAGLDESIAIEDSSLAALVADYKAGESPAKLLALMSLVEQLRSADEKIVVWSNFVGAIELIVAKLREAGFGAEFVYGATPFETRSVSDEATREERIAKFLDETSGIDILVANPAACAESISLHRTCSHAIYYDLSYNCAQYVQSLDRIHRVGGSENKQAQYHFLEYKDTIDHDILLNVRRKARLMNDVIDHEFPIYELDMFSDNEELDAYSRLFG
ncbi:MAG: hypothetical protein CMJ58_28655 [Planctomycetaceae bacterium]|nr:hypothetical protein [Planctomycetaceae bacterium]